ncbi:hypothetical protein [Streptomyces canus]|uniref:hypothetical protein n=1 Tax=Streptomyces canus TaxID=58343 RepID=UPI000361BB99|nr:hypothetical protein [Streptomyces canus]
MRTTTSPRETTSTTLRRDSETARHSAVIAPLSALLLPTASVAGRIAAGADCPAMPPGPVIPLVVAGLLIRRTNGWTTGLALGVGLSIGVGALLTPNTGAHLPSGDTALIASTVAELVALAALVIAGAAACLTRKGARA